MRTDDVVVCVFKMFPLMPDEEARGLHDVVGPLPGEEAAEAFLAEHAQEGLVYVVMPLHSAVEFAAEVARQ